MPETYVYRHIWRIADDNRPLSALRTEAAAVVDVLAALAGAKLVGDSTLTVAGDRMVLEAAAVPLPPDAHPELASVVVRLVWVGWPDTQIAEALDLPLAEVVAVRESRGLPAVGEPEPLAEVA